MRLRRIIFWFLIALALMVVAIGALIGSAWSYLHPSANRISGIVYGKRHGHSLTIDIVKPEKPNGKGVVLIFSGAWLSHPKAYQPWIVAPLTRRGYTVFTVFHLSQPEATIMEIVDDVNRAVRFVRLHAREHGVDPNRLGVTGGSAGGHLSLMLATCGAPGPANSADPVDRQSSAVQAAAVFFPLTDFLTFGTTNSSSAEGPPKLLARAFGPQATNSAAWKKIAHDISPLYHINSNLPPILIFHGDKDAVVHLDQSERFCARAKQLGCKVQLIVRAGKNHGWIMMLWDVHRIADWFDLVL